MRQIECSPSRRQRQPVSTVIPRRDVLGTSALALAGWLSSAARGQEAKAKEKEAPERKGPPQEMRERIEESRAFAERMRNAGSMEERLKIMEERRAQDRRRAIENLKEQLRVSEAEWKVVQPRIEAVYNRVHPPSPSGAGNAPARTEVEQKSRELRELLRTDGTPADQIKAGLTALRAAKEKARQELAAAQQNLRQILTLRQEAVLVLNGLLD